MLLSSQVNITVKVIGSKIRNGSSIYLGRYRGTDFTLVDSVTLSNLSAFQFKEMKSLEDGIYEIDFDKKDGLPIVITTHSKTINVKIKYSQSEKAELLDGDDENRALKDLLRIKKSIQAKLIV